MKKTLLFISIIISLAISGQTKLVQYSFNNSLAYSTDAADYPPADLKLVDLEYGAPTGYIGGAISTGIIKKGEGGYVKLTISTKGYYNLRISFSGLSTNQNDDSWYIYANASGNTPTFNTEISNGYKGELKLNKNNWANYSGALAPDELLANKSSITIFIVAYSGKNGGNDRTQYLDNLIVTGCKMPDPPKTDNQSFCGSAKVSDLVTGEASGKTIFWYNSAGELLSKNSSLSTGIYYAEQKSTGTTNCPAYPSERTQVNVNVYPLSVAGTVSSAQTICAGSLPMDLTLKDYVGNVIKWEKSKDKKFTNISDINIASATLSGSAIGAITDDTYFRAVVQSGSCNVVRTEPVLIKVNPSVPASVSITASPGTPICAGMPVTFTAAPVNGGTAPSYQWKVNGINAGGNAPVFTSTLLKDKDVVTVVMTSSASPCLTGSPATSTYTVQYGESTTFSDKGWTIDPAVSVNLSAEILSDYRAKDSKILNVCSMHIKNTAQVVIESGSTLKIYNELKVDAGARLTVETDANLIQINDDAQNTGKVTVKRDSKMSRLDYIYWGTPVTGQVLGSFSPATVTNRFYTYNEAYDSFSIIAPLTQKMVPGEGYVIRAPNNFAAYPTKQTFTGVFTGMPNNGKVEVSSSFTSPTRGRNLAGNPYPSNMNLELLTDENPTLTGVYYFWTNFPDYTGNGNAPVGQYGNYKSNHYATYSSSGGVSAEKNPNKKPSAIIKPGQGFLYKAKSPGTLTFKNNMRTESTVDKNGGSSIFFSNNAKQSDSKPSPERFWLRLTTPDGNQNTLLLAYIEGATDGFDTRYDAPFPVASSDRFYSISEDRELIIQGKNYPFDAADSVPLGMSHFVAGEYTVEMVEKEGVFANGQNVYLKDRQTGIVANLSEGNYTYTAEAGESTGRFEVVYNPQVVLATDNSVKEDVQIYRDAAYFVIKSPLSRIDSVEIFDMSGKLVHGVKPLAHKVSIDSVVFPEGVYVIKIMADGKMITKKIMK